MIVKDKVARADPSQSPSNANMARLLPVRIYEGETLVQVISGAGSQCGVFAWPSNCIDMLTEMNQTTKGYYFAWNDTNRIDDAVTAHGAQRTYHQGEQCDDV